MNKYFNYSSLERAKRNYSKSMKIFPYKWRGKLTGTPGSASVSHLDICRCLEYIALLEN